MISVFFCSFLIYGDGGLGWSENSQTSNLTACKDKSVTLTVSAHVDGCE